MMTYEGGKLITSESLNIDVEQANHWLRRARDQYESTLHEFNECGGDRTRLDATEAATLAEAANALKWARFVEHHARSGGYSGTVKKAEALADAADALRRQTLGRPDTHIARQQAQASSRYVSL